jgi:hypothetical protein
MVFIGVQDKKYKLFTEFDAIETYSSLNYLDYNIPCLRNIDIVRKVTEY